MAIARVLAVKRFRRQLVKLKHPDVVNWTDRQLKNAIFRNGTDWVELARWLLSELDEEIKDCLTSCADEDRATRIKESILVLGLCSADKAENCIKGRVVFKERDELVTELMELVKMKKAIDAGERPCFLDAHGIEFAEVKKNKESKDDPHTSQSSSNDKTEVLTARELLDLLFTKSLDYHYLMNSAGALENLPKELEDLLSKQGIIPAPKVRELAQNSDDSSSTVDVVNDDPPVFPGTMYTSVIPEPKKRNKSSKRKAKEKLKTEVEKHQMVPSPLTTAAKEVYGEDSPDVRANSGPSLPFVWNDGPDVKCDTGPTTNLVNKSGVEQKPLNYLDAVHELVKDLERTCQLAK